LKESEEKLEQTELKLKDSEIQRENLESVQNSKSNDKSMFIFLTNRLKLKH
jgi:hypothetical protein